MSKKLLLEKSVAEAVSLIKLSLGSLKGVDSEYELYCLNLLKTYEDRANSLMAEGVEKSDAIEEGIKYIKQYRTNTRPEDLALQKLLTDEELKSPDWANKVRNYFGSVTGHGKELRAIAENVLNQSAAMKHQDWDILIRELIDCSEIYSEVTLDVYGVALNFEEDEDEGGVSEQFQSGDYSTLGLVFKKILLNRDAIQHPEWDNLVKYALDSSEKYSYSAFDEAEALFSTDWVREHNTFTDLYVYFIQKNARTFRFNHAVNEVLNTPWVKQHKDFEKILAAFKTVNSYI